MPDLTRMSAWTCCTNTWWSHVVPGSKTGTSYTVSFGPAQHGHVQYDYACTCKAYEFGGGKYCKHIEAVKNLNLRCGWNAELEPTAQVLTRDGEHKCPHCGGDVESIKVAV